MFTCLCFVMTWCSYSLVAPAFLPASRRRRRRGSRSPFPVKKKLLSRAVSARPLSKVSAGHRRRTRHVSPEDTRPAPAPFTTTPLPEEPARCFRPWRRARSESRRRLIWRCSGKWRACPRIGNASTATSAARPMSTWQWAPSSVPPAPGSCECLWVKVLWVTGRLCRFAGSCADLSGPLAR